MDFERIDEAMIPSQNQQPGEEDLNRIAALTSFEYETQREKLAKDLGVRLTFLDVQYKASKKQNTGEENAGGDPFDDLALWDTPVEGRELLDLIRNTLLRFCVLPSGSAELIAVWIVHSHAHQWADISPILTLTSGDKRCGKTTTASVVAAMVPKPMHLINVSPSVVFRVIQAYCPTMIIDEGDTFLSENEDMRGLLNGGHDRRTAYVWRSTGDDHEPTRFRVWSPKLIAMIGHPPDTVVDRSIMVHLRRKLSNEVVERFHSRQQSKLTHIGRKAARWVADNGHKLEEAEPSLPDELNDRAQDNARPLVAIADLAGGHWPQTIRDALIASAQKVEGEEPASAGIMLLRDIQEVTASRRGASIGSTQLLEMLLKLEDSAWPEWRRGEPITARGIAKLLKPYSIQPERDRSGSFYRFEALADAFERYLPQAPEKSTACAISVTQPPNCTEKHNENKIVTLGGTCDDFSEASDTKCTTHNNHDLLQDFA